MGMQYDVLSANLTASGTAFGGPARLKGIYVLSGASGGTVDFVDGGASGTVRMSLDMANSAHQYMLLPGEGVRFSSDLYVTLSGDISSVTVFYG